MNLKQLIKKIEKLNQINKELCLGDEYYLAVEERNCSPICIHNSKELKKITSEYIKELAEKILNNELIKHEDRYYDYEIEDTKYMGCKEIVVSICK